MPTLMMSLMRMSRMGPSVGVREGVNVGVDVGGNVGVTVADGVAVFVGVLVGVSAAGSLLADWIVGCGVGVNVIVIVGSGVGVSVGDTVEAMPGLPKSPADPAHVAVAARHSSISLTSSRSTLPPSLMAISAYSPHVTASTSRLSGAGIRRRISSPLLARSKPV